MQLRHRTPAAGSERATQETRTVVVVAKRHPDPDLNLAFLHQSRIRLVPMGPDEAHVDRIHAESPSLVIDDLGEGAPRALQRVRALRSDPRTASIPLLVVSSRGGASRARALGAEFALIKPLVPHEFFAAVRRFVPLPERRHERFAINLRFCYELGGRTGQAFTRNVSLNGAFLKTDMRLPVGAHLALHFTLPGDPQHIRCGAVVRQGHSTCTGRGIGIEFEGIRDEDLARLERYIGSRDPRRGR